MSCGCKNKSNSQPPPPPAQPVNPQNSDKTRLQTENVKETIKKTVEKYYSNGKGTNGWVK